MAIFGRGALIALVLTLLACSSNCDAARYGMRPGRRATPDIPKGIPKLLIKLAEKVGANLTELAGTYNSTLLSLMTGNPLTPKGDKKGNGVCGLALLKTANSYNVGVFAQVLVKDIGYPVMAGIYDSNGLVLNVTATWFNNTDQFRGVLDGIAKKVPTLAKYLPYSLYQYIGVTVLVNSTAVTSEDGGTLTATLNSMMASPKSYYAKFDTAAYTSGALKGNFTLLKKK